MDEIEPLTVGQVAVMFDVTVRTLHHYDRIGLLVPSSRSDAGYRLYTEDDLRRLATVVGYRRLGLALDDVAELLRGESSLVEHLVRQRESVTQQMAELTALAAAIDRALEKEMNKQPATAADLKDIFGDGYRDEWQQEAADRWGETDAWAQSRQRTQKYTKADWEQLKAETEQINARFVAALSAGLPAGSAEAMDAAEAAREQMNARFFDCDHAFHRCLGDMYVADPRFTKTYEDLVPGLAQYVRDAIHANADRHRGPVGPG